MSTINKQRQWTAYLSNRLWMLGALLIVLSALALMQYRWIDQVAEAQRQRTEANLTAAVSNIESDFDIEITRAFEVFQVPFADMDYAKRYEGWRHHAPYPKLIRGVYITAARTDVLPKPVIPGETPIHSVEWRRNLEEMGSSFGGVAMSAPGPLGFQVFSTGGGASPLVAVDGNPAFAFRTMLSGPRVTRRVTVRPEGKQGPFAETEIVRSAERPGPPEWVVVVFDAGFIRSTFLPTLVQRYLRNSSGSDYDVTVVDRNGATPSSVVFPARSATPQNEFAHPDAKTDLFKLRLDCFSPSPSTKASGVVGAGPQIDALSVDSLSEILSRKPTACNNPAPGGSNADASWEMLVKYRNGSLDQAMTTFRRRNLFVSGTVLLVLALGVSMVVFLTERARALAEMQAEFILGVSHELRTPLTVISVAADNLKKGMVENREQAYRYGDIIDTQAAELSNMIEETLSLARIRSEVIRHRSSVAPEQIVKDALADSESALRHSGMEVELDVAPELPSVNVDLNLIRRCLGNLIQNAIKYAAAGQWIAVRARKVRRHNQETVEISVEDHGPGISPDDLPHIFEPFYRGNPGEAPQVAGIGLGLTLVKRAVEAHDGAVEVESTKVTRFSILLPAQDVQPAQEAV